MKTKSWWGFSILLLALLALAQVRAADTAVVKDAVVNVRGQPTIFSEVVTQLKAGESVVILEELTIPKPKADEPALWARIQLPVNTPVWVSTQFVDAETKTVKARHLNVRAGAGENYSVVGLLEKGAVIKEIRKVDNWMEIEAPPNAYAFVAVNLLEKVVPRETPAPEVVAVPTAPPAAAPKVATPPPAPPQPAPQPPPTVQTLEKETPPAVAITPPPTLPPPTPVVTLPAETAKPAEPKPEPPVVTLPPVALAEPRTQEPPPKRVITREGIITSTVSIQAPTYFGLISPESRKTIDYIYTTATNYNLKRLIGSRVIVTGEEYMDARWPSTPVLKVDVLQLAPR